jgi:glutamate dehydrogenase
VGVTDPETADAADDISAAVVGLAKAVVDNYGPPALPEFARAYLRRPAGSASALVGDPEALLAEIRGAFDLASGRDGAPAAVRAFTPTRPDHGYEAAGSVLETNTPDLPFLVDSITAELWARGLRVVRVAHPILGIERDTGGRIARVVHPREAPRESIMHFELDRRLAPDELAALEDAARSILATVRAVVEDFPAMRDAVAALAAGARGHEDSQELGAFLDWLLDDHFVFLGLRDGERELGLLARHPGAWRAPVDDPPEASAGAGLAITKTNALSPVHRREPLDAILLPGGARILGMFTQRAYTEPASTTPLLRSKLQQIVDDEYLIERSHGRPT